jgi:maltose O-acetyltransferase
MERGEMRRINEGGADKRSKTPGIIRWADWLLDEIVPCVRWLLLPFRLMTLTGEAVSRLIWLLSNEYAKRSFGECGKGVRLHGRFYVSSPQRLFLEENVHINQNAFLRAEGGLRIGANTHISRNLVVYTMNHDFTGSRLPYDDGRLLEAVTIGRNVWIGMNVIILPGVTVGDGAIIGAGTVVAKDVAPGAIVGSAPQRVLKERDREHYRALDEAGKYSGMSGYPWKKAP